MQLLCGSFVHEITRAKKATMRKNEVNVEGAEVVTTFVVCVFVYMAVDVMSKRSDAC